MDPPAHGLGGVRDSREIAGVDEAGVVGQDVSDGHALGQGRPAVPEIAALVRQETRRDHWQRTATAMPAAQKHSGR